MIIAITVITIAKLKLAAGIFFPIYIYLGIEYFETADFDPGPGVAEHISVGHADIALVKLGPDGSYKWSEAWGSIEGDGADSCAFDSNGDFFMVLFHC